MRRDIVTNFIMLSTDILSYKNAFLYNNKCHVRLIHDAPINDKLL